MSYFKTIYFPINKNIHTEAFPFASNPKYKLFYDYEWIYVFGGMMAFFAAYGIGANDVANSFAPSVGAKTLKLWQACFLAAICEFLGAYLLGARVTDTIKGKIANPSAFVGNDDLLMFGMLTADIATGVWLLLATKLELPVSTTHSVIGAIIGFSVCSPAGTSAVDWPSIGTIVASWFVSPILSGIASAGMFWTVRRFILRHDDSYERALKFYPIILFVVITLNLSFILIKSAISNGIVKGLDAGEGIGVSAAAGLGAAILSYFTLVRHFRVKYADYPLEDPDTTARKQRKEDSLKPEVDKEKVEETAIMDAAAVDDTQQTVKESKLPEPSTRNVNENPSKFSKFEKKMDWAFGGGGDIHGSIETNSNVGNVHDHAEVFPYRTECVFGLLQVITACAGSFAHGANDVANAVGPFSAVTAIYQTGSIEGAKKVAVPDWILLMGASAIVLGLATYGYKIIAAMGVKMVKITPSRGFNIELGTSIIIIIGSFLGLPLSTTHSVVGATVGVGIVEGRKGVNWKIIGRSFFGWVITLVVTASIAAAVFSLCTFAPSQYYPMSKHNCITFYGTVYNSTKTGFAGPLSVPLNGGFVKIMGGYQKTGEVLDIFKTNPK